MKIGELARSTGVHPRMLRYYEQRGLLEPTRDPNGYRSYGAHQVERVKKIRGLLDSGVPLRVVAQILPCVGEEIMVEQPWPDLRETLVDQRDKLSERVELLVKHRDALTAYIDSMDQLETPDGVKLTGPR